MLISWQGTDWCAKSMTGDLYDSVTSITCMTGQPLWPVWQGDFSHQMTSITGRPLYLYDWATSMTCMTRRPLSPGDCYDLHVRVTSMNGWPPWPCDLYDLNDWVTSMTWRPPWPGDFYDCAGRHPGEGWLLFCHTHFPPTTTLHWYINIAWHSRANIPSHLRSPTNVWESTHQPTRDELKQQGWTQTARRDRKLSTNTPS